MTKPFRFGVQVSSLPPDGWERPIKRIESLGYSSVFCPDHFSNQWDPTTLLAGAAAVTETLRVGSLVYGIDYRHPVIYAKQAATLHLLSRGRHEFGIGAGWMQTDYDQAGMDYERPGLRIERLEEALQIIRAMWEGAGSSFEGKHYRTADIPQAAELPQGEGPPILIGGGGRKLLSVAGRHADIVGINPSLPEGKVTGETPADLAPERVREKVGWVHEAAQAAGRDPETLEFNSLVFVVAITPDPRKLREGLARGSGMSVDQASDCPLFLTGPATEIRDRLEKRREETGISYVVIQGRDPDVLEKFADEIVAPLSGK